MTVSLEIRHLSVRLQDGTSIIEDISFIIPKGQLLCVVGSSGAGKSTLCKAIMGLLNQNYEITGEVLYDGSDLLKLETSNRLNLLGSRICYIMQNPMTAFNPSIRIGAQLAKSYRKHHKKASQKTMQEEIENCLSTLGMTDIPRILKSYPHTLSGGMLQRLMIGVALINTPDILIADEMTTAIDACNQKALMEEVMALCEKGISVLFVTHDMRVARQANQILVMHNGQVIEQGDSQEVFYHPKHSYTKELVDACFLQRRERS